MNRARKFFRSSGRVLSFIFAASVVWLLFDMAALKLSFSDTNSKLLKEQLMRGERGSFKEWKQQVLQERLITGPMFRRDDRPPSHVDFNPDRFKDRIRNRFQRKKQLPLPLGNVEHHFNKPALPEQATGPFLEPDAPPALDAQINDKRDFLGRAVNSSELQSERWAHGPSQIPLVTHNKAPVNLTAAHTSAAQRKHPAQNVDKPGNADQRREAGNGKVISLSPSHQAPEVNRTQKTPSNSSGLPTKQPAYQAAEPAGPEMGDVMLVHKILPNETNAGRQVARPIADLDAAQLGKNNANTTVKLQNIDGIKLAVNTSITKTYVGQAFERLSNVTQKPNTPFLNRLKSKHTSNKLDDTHNANTTTHKVNSSNLYEHVVIKGADLGTGNATESKPPNIINQQEVGNVLTVLEKKAGLHKVLTIDITMSPRNHYAIGQYGRAAEVPKGKEEESERRWKEGYFNAYLSDLIPIDRAIVDTRPHGCSEKLVHDHLPSTSIIMCFVDELWSTLLRSVMSVLNRSPAHLIKEVILVDDFSTKEHLKEKLDQYMLQFPKVRILHLKKRYGLIRARLAGASIATGDVLTFLDSHVECNVGWLEPLLESVYLNRKKVSCPVIEVISGKDMSYMTVDNFQRGIFSWPLNFGWKPIPPEEIKKNNIKESDPIRCPVMAGGLFSIDKNYFYELGTYDPGLEVWGGENMELSFKVWMCGGEIEINPCSRVGHIFRNDNPYSFPKDRLKTVEKNLARVAEVWMDEYKELFYGHGYHMNMQKFEIGDLTQQKALRKSLQCKSFKWYLENVFPDLDAPVVMASGLLKNMGLDKCLGIKNSTVFFDTCNSTNENQQFNYTWLRLIKQGDICLAPINGGGKIALHLCDDMNNNMKWLHKSLVTFQPLLKDHIVVEPVHSPVCLEVDRVHKVLRTNPCDPLNHFQKWTFGKYLVEG